MTEKKTGQFALGTLLEIQVTSFNNIDHTCPTVFDVAESSTSLSSFDIPRLKFNGQCENL